MRDIFTGSKMPRVLLALWVTLSLFVMSVASAGGASAFAATPVMAGGTAVVVNTGGDPIRIRQGAGTEFAQIGVAYGGQAVSVLAGPSNDKASKQWFKIQAPGGTGWMSADFLQGTSSPASAVKLTGSAVVANTDGDPLRMRAAASASSQVLTLLNAGSTVTIQEGPLTDATGVAWYAVSAKGYNGWAMVKYLGQAPGGAVQAVNKDAVPESKPAVVVKPAVVATAVPTQKPATQPKATPTAAVQTKSVAASGPGQYRQWMEEARALYPYKQTLDKMWSVMMCESGGNPGASNGGRYLGLYQYAPTTWGGSWNPYRGSSIWDAKSQIFATAKAWSIGMQSAWSCYYITPGR